MKFVLFLFLILFQFDVFAQSCKPGNLDNLSQIAATTCSNEAIEMITKLKTQGFHCDEPSLNTPKRGILCKGKVGSYSQPVRIYISPNYKNKSQAKINLHFHGHRLNGIDTFQINQSHTNGHGDYGARLVESKSTDLLVIPESLGNCATYNTELNDQQEMKNFILSLEKTTGIEKANYSLMLKLVNLSLA